MTGWHLILPERHYRLKRFATRAGGTLWERHPHVRSGSQLTIGERAADGMRNGFGSWTFVGAFALFLAAWMVLNTVILKSAGSKGFDPFPYILLNLCLSCLAALQGAFILIAAKRADRVAAEQATSHYAETSKLDVLLTQNNTMTGEIRDQTALLADIHAHVTGRRGR